jgi:hypothetical protein
MLSKQTNRKLNLNAKGLPMLWTIIVILLVLWLLGLLVHIGGNLIHILLVIALIILILNFIRGKRGL